MSAPAAAAALPHDPYAALRSRNYRDYLLGSFLALIGRQAVTVAASWEVYQWTHSATALGLVGLINVLPVLALSLPAGALADRRDRRRLVALSQIVLMGLSTGLALLSAFHARLPAWPLLRSGNGVLHTVAMLFEHHAGATGVHFDEPALPLMFLLLLAIAVARILAWPARTAIIPCLNEEQGIEKVLRAMPEFVDEVVVVDNNSTDRTSDVARSLGAIVLREEVRGYGRRPGPGRVPHRRPRVPRRLPARRSPGRDLLRTAPSRRLFPATAAGEGGPDVAQPARRSGVHLAQAGHPWRQHA